MSDETVEGSDAAAMPAACVSCAVSRRQFIASSTLAAVGALLAACGGSGGTGPNNPPPPFTSPVTVKISDFPALSQDLQPVAINASVAAVRTSAGNFLAFSRACTHQGNTIGVEGNIFHCPAHDSRFTATGQLVNGPAAAPLDQLPAAFDATAGTLTISPA